MGKHGNHDNNTKPESKSADYRPKHSGPRDGFEWADGRAEDTVELPKVKKSNERW